MESFVVYLHYASFGDQLNQIFFMLLFTVYLNDRNEACINQIEEDDFCNNIDICDDEGEITSNDKFCKGEAIRDLSEDPWNCPVGYHWIEDDESGLCYTNDKECKYDTLIFNEDKTGCLEYKIDCDFNENNPLCNGQEITDGIKVCDDPSHPGYRFCKDNNN